MKKIVAKKPKSIEGKIDDLARMMAKGFASLENKFEDRFQRMETIMATKADRADILALHDRFVHRREFDELSLRVSKIEEKVRK